MNLREIEANETDKLMDCVTQLSQHHNQVSVHFKGCYPSRPYEDTIHMFYESLKNGQSRIAVVEDGETVVGFSKINMDGTMGKLDYLAVLQEYRQQGIGKQLMDWAIDTFRKNGITRIEVKVVDGNPAIKLYETYGFQMNAHILWHCEPSEG